MKYLSILTFLLFAIVTSYSCNNNEDPNEPAFGYPSFRDGTFSGNRLTVTINGTKVESAKTAIMKSDLYESNPTPDGLGGNPTYKSTIIIYDFPNPRDKTTLSTITNLRGFKDEIMLDGKIYIYTGTFTGDPLHKHENQGLIIDFVNK